MAWVETRGKRKPVHSVRWRDENGDPDEAAFDCLDDAQEWLRLVVAEAQARSRRRPPPRLQSLSPSCP
jgi:hypothetical protein